MRLPLLLLVKMEPLLPPAPFLSLALPLSLMLLLPLSLMLLTPYGISYALTRTLTEIVRIHNFGHLAPGIFHRNAEILCSHCILTKTLYLDFIAISYSQLSFNAHLLQIYHFSTNTQWHANLISMVTGNTWNSMNSILFLQLNIKCVLCVYFQFVNAIENFQRKHTCCLRIQSLFFEVENETKSSSKCWWKGDCNEFFELFFLFNLNHKADGGKCYRTEWSNFGIHTEVENFKSRIFGIFYLIPLLSYHMDTGIHTQF